MADKMTIDPTTPDPAAEIEDFVCNSAAEFANTLGVSERQVGTWKARGMPYTKGNPAPIPMGPALRWLRENGFLGAASQPDRSPMKVPADDSPSIEQLNKLFSELDRAIESNDWARAIRLMVCEINLFQGQPESIPGIINELEGTGPQLPCTGESIAIRIAKTRCYLWADMRRGFADAFCGLVNTGMLHAVPADESPWPGSLDLPLAKDPRKPTKHDCRANFEFTAAPVDGAVKITLEAVAKRNLKMMTSL